ncbi:MAG: ABC transporter ATP-binding protein [Saprospiraceae bacterium]|nr:ABC transporter ATP-binding protein [Saprospiraceae bacterium]MCF8249870.1 ABC transporter ATP-binding protein [Saprospiraceae bacterium]MCF8279460.1 ABC transporter ATP-binding protein [Bacteroidales bacterium]MCF8311696.1 ABC transporter ATP-binding protein [Saprospiraceae bacterium]MCF8440263.1 ABC transporter ATP-binding protein [Saprospiraceae bacterium]
MQIKLEQVSKRYRYEWIFKGIDYQLVAGGRYAVIGPNGSGKSTLMKVLSGHLSPTKGKVEFVAESKKIAADDVYRQVSYAAPYIELIEEFTLVEALDFHQKFKPLLPGLRTEDVVDLLAFPKAKDKQVRHFSSGMKQRLKLALACCSASSLLLLDEPTTNLDAQGVDWYLALTERFLGQRTVVVASNVAVDYGFCEEKIDILEYK